MANILEVTDLYVAYGNMEALHGINISVEEGKVITILGANGAGKTTFLSAVSGVVPIKSGEIRYGGTPRPNAVHKTVEAGIVQVPEGRRIFGALSVMENLTLGGFLEKDKKKLMENAKKMMKWFPILEERKNQQAGTLSGGEQQMLAIARGLMANPRLLLLDEPSLGLSPGMVKEVFKMIEEIRATGITILLVEQNAAKALAVSDYAYVLDNGRIVMEGPSTQLANDENVKKAYLAG